MSKRKPRRRRSRAKKTSALPKGAYRLPTGGYVRSGPTTAPNKQGRRFRIVAVHRDEPDVDKITRAMLDIIVDEQQRGQG